jgi:hypothetical protein
VFDIGAPRDRCTVQGAKWATFGERRFDYPAGQAPVVVAKVLEHGKVNLRILIRRSTEFSNPNVTREEILIARVFASFIQFPKMSHRLVCASRVLGMKQIIGSKHSPISAVCLFVG